MLDACQPWPHDNTSLTLFNCKLVVFTTRVVAPLQIFCPKCEDIYYPRTEYQCSIDGAYFGTTFPHLMLMTYPSCRPPKASDLYVPRIFGFKLHPTAYGNRYGHILSLYHLVVMHCCCHQWCLVYTDCVLVCPRMLSRSLSY